MSAAYKSQLSQCKKLKTVTEMCWALRLTDTIQYIILHQKYAIPPH